MKSILAFLLTLALSLSVFGQASKQVLSVGTIADLHARRPQSNEVVSVRHGSASNLWVEPRLFVHDPAGSATPDDVFDVTNVLASGRYTATDKGSRIFDVRWFGAIPGTGRMTRQPYKPLPQPSRALGAGLSVREGAPSLSAPHRAASSFT